MRAIRPFGALVLAAGLLACGTGCSRYDIYNLFCEVRNADDDTPIEGVRAVLDLFCREDELKAGTDMEKGVVLKETTDPNGLFVHEIRVIPYNMFHDDRRWLLKLSKDGFHPAVVDITPTRAPEAPAHALALEVSVKMRPKAEKP